MGRGEHQTLVETTSPEGRAPHGLAMLVVLVGATGDTDPLIDGLFLLGLSVSGLWVVREHRRRRRQPAACSLPARSPQRGHFLALQNQRLALGVARPDGPPQVCFVSGGLDDRHDDRHDDHCAG